MTRKAKIQRAVSGLVFVGCLGLIGVLLVPHLSQLASRRERIQRQYAALAAQPRGTPPRYPDCVLPPDGTEVCLAAIRAAGDADRVCARVAPGLEVLLYRAPDHDDEHSRLVWQVSPNVLRVVRPEVDTSDGLDGREALRLHHFYASQWVKDHPAAHVEDDLLWTGGGRRLPDGTWSVESGMSQIAGHGLRSHIAADGSLLRIDPTFSSE